MTVAIIAIIVLSVVALLLGLITLFLLKINQTHAETSKHLQIYAQGLSNVEIENDTLKKTIGKQKSELEIAHQFLERLIVVVPDDVSLLKKEEVVSTSTEKESAE